MPKELTLVSIAFAFAVLLALFMPLANAVV